MTEKQIENCMEMVELAQSTLNILTKYLSRHRALGSKLEDLRHREGELILAMLEEADPSEPIGVWLKRHET